MANIKLTGNTWDTSGVYDAAEGKTQKEVNSGLKTALTKEPYNEKLDINLIVGERVTLTTGVISQDANYSRTDYIDCSHATSVTLKWITSSTTLNAICFYDENKVYVRGVVNALAMNEESRNYILRNNEKYFIVSGINSAMPNVEFTMEGIKSPICELWYNKADKSSNFDIDFVTTAVPLQNVIGVTKLPNNLVNMAECQNNLYVESGSGILTYGTNYFCTGYIPVTAGTTYKSNVGRNWAWYTENKAYISGSSGTGIQSGITAPENAAFIRFTINKTSDHLTNPIGLYFTDTSSYNANVYIDGFLGVWCIGKKINWLGDSIVAGSDFDEIVSSALGLVETDYGINGSTIALATDGTDGRNACVARYSSMTDTTDIIAVSCGTNDFEYAWCPIGTINDPDDGTSNNTFYGALKTLCKGLITKYPQKTIFFTTPIKRGQPFENGAGGEYTQDGVTLTPFSKNKYGKTLGDYADIIKEVCGYYSIPVLDLYNESLLNPSITAQQNMFDEALTHPTANGQKMMARRVCGWLTQLSYDIS